MKTYYTTTIGGVEYSIVDAAGDMAEIAYAVVTQDEYVEEFPTIAEAKAYLDASRREFDHEERQRRTYYAGTVAF